MFGIPDYIIRVAVADAAAYEAFYMTSWPSSPAWRGSTRSSR